MALTKTNITNLADDLIFDKGDADTLSAAFDNLIERLAKTTAPLVDTAAYTPTDGTSEYAYPAGAIRLLAVFHGAKQLPYAPLRDLETYSNTWRTTAAAEGTPVAYATAETDARAFFLFPTPDTTAADGGTILFAEDRESDIPEWLVFPFILEIAAIETSYPSDHQDKDFSDLAQELAEFFKVLLGI